MTRQNVLVAILALLVVVVLPWNYLDGALAAARAEVEEARDGLLPLARQSAELRRREAALAEQRKQVEWVRSRLIWGDPFASIQGELTAAARASGAKLGAFTLERGEVLAELPDILRYKAVVEVSGSPRQYLEFLSLLEHHGLLIELPEAVVRLQAAKGRSPEVRATMSVGFFAAIK